MTPVFAIVVGMTDGYVEKAAGRTRGPKLWTKHTHCNHGGGGGGCNVDAGGRVCNCGFVVHGDGDSHSVAGNSCIAAAF